MSSRPPDCDAVSLGNLLRAWGDAGEAPPAAIVASILHEVALASEDDDDPAPDVEVDAIWIDPEGEVSVDLPLTVTALSELTELGLSGYVPGRTGDLMPPVARSGIDRFRDWDGVHADGCVAFADWIRTTFGPLPEPLEVAQCCRASAPLDPDVPTTLPSRASSVPGRRVDPSEDLEVPAAVSSDSLEPTTIEGPYRTVIDTGTEQQVEAIPEPPTLDEATETGSMDLSTEVESSADDRPVVRKELPSRRERTVSLVSAPAARRSARPLAEHGDSILVPAEGSGARGWTLLLLGIGLAVVVYFLLVP